MKAQLHLKVSVKDMRFECPQICAPKGEISVTVRLCKCPASIYGMYVKRLKLRETTRAAMSAVRHVERHQRGMLLVELRKSSRVLLKLSSSRARYPSKLDFITSGWLVGPRGCLRHEERDFGSKNCY